ncbi:MAG TPA: type II toxin-antitoxin system ParD family antitoxin [Candidatus Angelobacter sp.]|nr:type II toxin-antitoxin system ParD family antitoxin [Candidatus Angelobacter sp.]
MKISLNPDTERMITEQISRGRYRSADEVVREGLELLRKREEGTLQPPSQNAANLPLVFGTIAADVPDADWAIVPVDFSKTYRCAHS